MDILKNYLLGKNRDVLADETKYSSDYFINKEMKFFMEEI
jgi:hypothetical protein